MSLGLIALQACAHNKTEKQIDEKAAKETQIKTRSDLRNEARSQIENSTLLTGEQKSKLLQLSDSTQSQLDELTSQSLKLRAVLIKDVIDTHYDAKEVTKIKKKIKTVEQNKLSVIFDAVDEANTILGRNASTHQHLIRQFLFERSSGAID